MKTEKFVDVETAIKLQKFDYDFDSCFGYYSKQVDESYSLNVYQEENDGYSKLRIDAPLISEVIDWLFNEYNIHIEFQFNDCTWYAYIGMFTLPDFASDNTVQIELHEESFSNAKIQYRNIKMLAIKHALNLIK